MVNTLRNVPRWRALLLACMALAGLRYCCRAFSSHPPWLTLQPGRRKITQHSFDIPAVRTELPLSGVAAEYAEEERSRPHIVVLKSQEDYFKFIEADNRLCVIKFYANWCKSCQRFGVKFRRLAFDEGDRVDAEGSVYHLGEARFAEAEYGASTGLCKSLKIKKLPTVHMYLRERGRVADMVCKPSKFQLVVDEMHRLLDNCGAVAKSSSPEAELETDIKLKIGRGEIKAEGSGNSTENILFDVNNGTGASFDEAMVTGSSLVDGLMESLRKEREESRKTERSWFPFTF